MKNHKQVIRDFAFAIEKLEGDEKYRQKLSLGALERAKDFSWESKIDLIDKIYQNVIEKHHHPVKIIPGDLENSISLYNQN